MCPRTEDGSEEVQYNYGDVVVHGPKEESCLRRGRDESKYSEAFQVGTRIWRERFNGHRGISSLE